MCQNLGEVLQSILAIWFSLGKPLDFSRLLFLFTKWGVVRNVLFGVSLLGFLSCVTTRQDIGCAYFISLYQNFYKMGVITLFHRDAVKIIYGKHGCRTNYYMAWDHKMLANIPFITMCESLWGLQNWKQYRNNKKTAHFQKGEWACLQTVQGSKLHKIDSDRNVKLVLVIANLVMIKSFQMRTF